MLHSDHTNEELREEFNISEHPTDAPSFLVEYTAHEDSLHQDADVNWPIWLRWANASCNLPTGINRLKFFLLAILTCYVVGFIAGILYATCYRRLYDAANFAGWVWQYGNWFAEYSICGGLLCLILLYRFNDSKIFVHRVSLLLAVLGISPVIAILLFLCYYLRPTPDMELWFILGNIFCIVQMVGIGSSLGAATSIFAALRMYRSDSGVSNSDISLGSGDRSIN